MSAAESGSRRGPAVFPTLLAAFVCALVASIALSSDRPQPPAVAEIGPRAAPPDEVAAPDQPVSVADGGSSGVGVGAEPAVTAPVPTPGASTPRSTTTTTPPDPAAIRRRCIPNGDGTARQTEDPQSPPCVLRSAFDAGNNGGSTWQGVTATEVLVAVHQPQSAIVDAWFAHFNDRFEFHGRQLVPAYLPAVSDQADVAAYTAAAVEVDEEHGVFASSWLNGLGVHEPAFHTELARRGVVSVHAGSVLSWTSDELAAVYPGAWSVTPPLDVTQQARAEWICQSLRGESRFGTHTGPDGDRVFGLIETQRSDGSAPSTGALEQRLQRCGVDFVARATFGPDEHLGTQAAYTPSPATRAAILEMQSNQVTTVVLETPVRATATLFAAAAQIGYEPEWVYPASNPFPYVIRFLPYANQNDSLFGLRWNDVELPDEVDPGMVAAREYDPAVSGGDYPTIRRYIYDSLLLIASGVQAAGPDLTPQSFADGLVGLDYANPGVGRDPFRQATVGFRAREPWMTRDAALMWLDAVAPARTDLNNLCFLDGGVRFADGRYPDDDRGIYAPRSGCATQIR